MDEASRLRRKDTTKGPPLRILSLDGGGIRGFSMLIMLQELMHRTFVEIEGRAPKRHEIPRPCDHFDLIAGTGTGGLIALMLGRLRLDLDTCKELYVRMTRRVFETDKTFAGIPLKSTMFKASKLEEVIKECVREHTVSEREGNDTLANATPISPDVAGASNATSPASSTFPQRTLSQSSRYSQMGMAPMGDRMRFGSLAFGNANALLYDTRDDRTKTAVAAVLKGTSVTTLLRSYDSRREPAPEVNCTIWEAGRATSATLMAFKPIQIGQSWYLDEGSGKYNPAPAVLDEAVRSEWPGRDVGVFVSIGTGKRPAGTNNEQHEWWEGFLGGSMGAFAEARRRLISKLEGCEETHQYMIREHLGKRNVNPENYYRLNVEVGVGEFGMNEWQRLSEISTNTRIYLSRSNVESLNSNAAAKMAKIHFAKLRHERAEARTASNNGDLRNSWDTRLSTGSVPPNPMAVELQGDDMYYQTQSFRPGAPYEHRPSIADQKYVVVSEDRYSVPPDSANTSSPTQWPAQPANGNSSPYQSPHPATRRPDGIKPRQSHPSFTTETSPTQNQSWNQGSSPPPPLPPKTPINALPYPEPLSPPVQSPPANGPRTFMNMGDLGRRLPYPDVEGPPPVVNTASKPQVSR